MTPNKNDLTYAEKRLLLFLSNFSAEKPVAKEDVLCHLNINVRAFRNLCLDLRNKGYKICFSLNRGYYIADNKEEYLKFRDNYTSYSRTIRKAVGAMDKSTLYRSDIRHLLNRKAVDTNAES